MTTSNVKTDYAETAFLNVYRSTNITGFAAYVALYTTAPAEDGTGGVEVSGGSYARQLAGFSAPTNPGGSPAPMQIVNASIITFPTATGSWGTITHAGIVDAVTSGNIWDVIPLDTSQLVSTGNTFSIAASALVVTEN